MNVKFVESQLQQLLADTSSSNHVIRDKYLIETAMILIDHFEKESSDRSH